MQKELEYLGGALERPKRPFVAILGGSKISGKIDVIEALLPKVDALLVVKLDRLFRSLHQLIETLNEWSSIGVQFVAVNDQIDLTTAAGRLMMQIIGAFAEFESNIIRERVTAGVRAKKEKTGKWGRPTCDETTVAKIKKLRGNGLSMGDIAKELGISKGTVFNHSKSE